MFTKEIESHLEKLLIGKFDESREMNPEYFSEILNNGIMALIENSQEFIKANFLHDKAGPLLNELIQILKLESDEHKEIVTDFFYTAIMLISSIEYFKNEGATKIFLIHSEIDSFRKESFHRIITLRNQLLEKHPSLDKMLSEKFEILIKGLEADMTLVSSYLAPLNKIEHEGMSISNTLLSQSLGRPSDPLIEMILLSIDEIATKISSGQRYAKVIIPTMSFLSNKFPETLDINDYTNYDSLRKRISYIVKKHNFLEVSQTTGE